MVFFCYLFSERKLICYLWLYLIYCLTIVTTFTYKLTDCDLTPRCMNEYNTSTVEDLSNITCSISMTCDIIDASPINNPQNSLYIALEKFNIINQDNVSSLVEISLAGSLPPQHEIEGTFIFQIAFGDNGACYNFVIPFASFSSNKESFLLPCIQLHLPPLLVQRIFVYTHYKELESANEIITLQVAKYTLKDTSTVQVLQSGFMNIVPVLHKTHIYLTSNVDEDAACPFFYKIFIIESDGNDVCDPVTQKVVCRWISALKSPNLCLNCTRHNLIPSQTYCIYAHFFDREECKYIHPDETVQITFFKISPEKFYKDIVSLPSCKGWNATIYVKVTLEKRIVVEFSPWYAYDNCFLSYEFRLYTVRSRDCGAGNENPIYKLYVDHPQQNVTKSFPAIQNGIYCFLMIPCDMGICYREWSRRYKKNIIIEDQGSILTPADSTENVYSQKIDLNVKIAMGLLVLITGLVLVRCLVKKFRNAKDLSYCKNKNFDDFKMEHEIIPLMLYNIIVYIFHSFDENTQQMVDILVNFLQKCANIEVKTIKEASCEIILRSDSYLWFKDITECKCGGEGPTCSSNVRFIIVLSGATLELIAESDSNTFQGESEKRMFCDILKYVQGRSSYNFSNNHFQVFKVCFDDRFYVEETNISSGSSYNMRIKERVLDLCMDLGAASINQVQRDDLEEKYKTHEIRDMSLNGS